MVTLTSHWTAKKPEPVSFLGFAYFRMAAFHASLAPATELSERRGVRPAGVTVQIFASGR